MLRALHVAFGFLTTLPLPPGPTWLPMDLRRSVRAYPVVGLVLGLLLSLGYLLLRSIGLPELLNGPVLLAVWLLLTGALHFDGFCDVADAALASTSRTERQRIAKDPHLGAFALAAGGCLLLIKAAALASLPHWGLLVVILTLGRSLVIWPIAFIRTSSSSTLGRSVQPSRLDAFLPLFLGLALTAGWSLLMLNLEVYLWVLGVGSAGMIVMAIWLAERLDGLSGDAYGALIETSEALMLITAVAVYA